MDHLTEMLKGILEGCVLQILSQEKSYGYEITRKLHELGFEEVVEGTVYTILLRLERNKLVNTQKILSKNGPPRKCYSLTDTGFTELALFWERWSFLEDRIHRLKEETNENERV